MPLKLCSCCFTMKNISKDKVVCKRCEKELDKELKPEEEK